MVPKPPIGIDMADPFAETAGKRKMFRFSLWCPRFNSMFIGDRQTLRGTSS